MATARGDNPRCFLEGCNKRASQDSRFCCILHSNYAVQRGQVDACAYCRNLARTPGFPTCSKNCGRLLAWNRARFNGPNSTSHSSLASGSSPSASTTTAQRTADRDGGPRSIQYLCGCTIFTSASNPPNTCPICPSSTTAPSQTRRGTPSAPTGPIIQNSSYGARGNAHCAQDTKYQMPGGFRPPVQSKYSTRGTGARDTVLQDLDPFSQSGDEGGRVTPCEVVLPESPTVETTSGSDSAVLVDFTGPSRSGSMNSAPPAYDDKDWTAVEPPSRGNSPAGDPSLTSLLSKKLPSLPPRPKRLAGYTMTSQASGVISNAGKDAIGSPSSSWKGSAPESSVVTTRPFANSRQGAISPPAPSNLSSFPIFPSAPTTAPGVSGAANGPSGKPLVIADPKTGDTSGGFSNYDPFPIEYKDRKYPSGEHLFHAMKFMDTRPLLAQHICECDDPKREAARFIHEQNSGWDQMQLQKMEEVIRLKCKQHSTFKEKLRETEDDHIYFHDDDPFWGTGPDGRGENQFGQVLMKVRGTLGKGFWNKKSS